MGEVIRIKNANELEKVSGENELVELTVDLLTDVRTSTNNQKMLSVPIAELATLGAGVSSLIPAFNTVTQTSTIATGGLFRIANAAAGDTLKMAKNGNAWGAMKTATGGSKMVQLAETGPLSATTQSVAAFNPATMMMAVALYSIEKDIAEMLKRRRRYLHFWKLKTNHRLKRMLKR